MAALTQTNSTRMYSWWWDSHICPKNSKWLQDNLTDMDAKVKAMIKLIEEDADSFARRAEMYYKKRPELMKLVEEFYRAYRALAERYDNATVVIRQAHRTMSEAFPNQVLPELDDPHGNSATGDPQTLGSTPIRTCFETDDLQKDDMELPAAHLNDGRKNGTSAEESDVFRKKGLKQLADLSGIGDHVKFGDGKVRKGLKFHDAFENRHVSQNNGNQPELVGDSKEILSLKESLAKVEAEREADLIQFREKLEKLSKLESEIAHAQEDSKGLSQRARLADAEIERLKEALTKLEAEKDAKLQDYRQCLDRISSLESTLFHAQGVTEELTQRAYKAETEVQSLKDELAKVVVEKDSALDQYVSSLEKISNLELKLQHAEEDAKMLKERAEKAENEVENLKEALTKCTEEKRAAEIQYKQCLETVSVLEHNLSTAREEAQRLNTEIENGIANLKGAEERCLLLDRSNKSLHLELESVMVKMGNQTQELTEKQKELGRLWTCIQEERMRFVEAETAFQTLQHLHAQAQEELRSLALELQNKVQSLNDMEAQNKILQDEVLKIKDDNIRLDNLNISSTTTIKELHNEVSSLTEAKGRLEEEVELRLDQRNALQQEIYCLKEELNDLNKKISSIMEQMHEVGLNPECFRLSVKELQDENSSLREIWEKEKAEKVALLEKLVILGQLLEKNSILENSLSDLNAEMEAVRERIRTLEASCQSLLAEKSSLTEEKASLEVQLEVANENLAQLSVNNTVLVNSLSDAHDELQGLKTKSKSLEDSWRSLLDEKSGLANENDYLTSELVVTNENLAKLSVDNTVLVNSLFDARDELQGLKTKSKSLEDSWHLLVVEKDSLASKNESLTSELENSQGRLENLEKKYAELAEKYSALEKEKDASVSKIHELEVSLEMQQQEHTKFAKLSESDKANLKTEMDLLQSGLEWTRSEFDKELDKAFEAETEIFILRRCAKDLQERNCSLWMEHQRLSDSCTTMANSISELKIINLNQKTEMKSLCDDSDILRTRLSQLLKSLGIVVNHDCAGRREQDHVSFDNLLTEVAQTKESFHVSEEVNQQLHMQISVLVTILGQLKLEAENIEMEKSILDQELRGRNEKLVVFQNEVLLLREMIDELKSKVTAGAHNEEVLETQISELHKNFLELEGSYKDLLKENAETLEEKESLEKEFLLLEEKNHTLMEENSVYCGKMFSLEILSLLLRNCVGEKSMELKALSGDFHNLNDVNDTIRQKLSLTERMLEDMLIQKETELQQLRKEHEKTKIQEATSRSELQMLRKDAGLWEVNSTEVYRELQTYNLCQILYEQVIRELSEAYEIAKVEIASRDSDVKLLKQREGILASENVGLSALLASYDPAISSLRKSISSLEKCAYLHGKLYKPEKGGQEDAEHFQKSNIKDEEDSAVLDPISDLENLQKKVESIEKAVSQAAQLLVQENQNVHAELNAAMQQIAELNSEGNSHRRNRKLTPEPSEMDNGLLTKDIMLDQASESSSYGISRRREQVGADNQFFESWEAADQDGIIDLTVSKASKKTAYPPSPEKNENLHRIKSVKKQRNDQLWDQLVEKELGVDKLEMISKKSSEPLQDGGNKRKVLERLNSDVQKLTNLQITIQDLRKKLQIIEKSKKGKSMEECDILKEQLEEAETAISKLFDLNGKLMKTIDATTSPLSSSHSRTSMELEENGSVRRRRISEQARKISEKIGRLQMEVQKIQFVLLKLDDGIDLKGKTKLSESKRRVLLRDYLYGVGGIRSAQRRKKTHFCSCVQPATQGD